MEIGNQIKKYRGAHDLSQEQLAEKIFVSRQTISNWENSKNYPDVKSLLLLSSVFDVSLDVLVKGDLKEMKEQLEKVEVKKFEGISRVFGVFLVLMIITPVPLVYFLGNGGFLIWGIIALMALFFGFKVEKYKKEHDIQTYREILAFTDGKALDVLDKNQELGKRSYQKVFLAIGSALITLAIAMLFLWLLN